MVVEEKIVAIGIDLETVEINLEIIKIDLAESSLADFILMLVQKTMLTPSN